MLILNFQDAIKWRTHEGPDSRSVLCPKEHSSVFTCVGIPLWLSLCDTVPWWVHWLRQISSEYQNWELKENVCTQIVPIITAIPGKRQCFLGACSSNLPECVWQWHEPLFISTELKQRSNGNISTECSTWEWCLLDAKQERLHRIHTRPQIPSVLLSMY